MLSTVDTVVQRRDGPRWLRDHDDDDDDDSHLAAASFGCRDVSITFAYVIATDLQQSPRCVATGRLIITANL